MERAILHPVEDKGNPAYGGNWLVAQAVHAPAPAQEVFVIGEFHALVLPDRIGRQADEALDESAVEDVCRRVATRHFMVIKFVDIAIIDIAADFLPLRLPGERE